MDLHHTACQDRNIHCPMHELELVVVMWFLDCFICSRNLICYEYQYCLQTFQYFYVFPSFFDSCYLKFVSYSLNRQLFFCHSQKSLRSLDSGPYVHLLDMDLVFYGNVLRFQIFAYQFLSCAWWIFFLSASLRSISLSHLLYRLV